MAWYNPNPVSFSPNSDIIKQAGAVGTFLHNKAQQDYQKAMEAKDRQFLLDKFAHQQAQDKITNDHWQKNYDQEQQKFIAGEGWKNLDDAYREKTYKLDKDKFKELKRQNDIAETANAAKLTQERNQNIYKGMYIAQQDPEFAKSVGATTEKTVMGSPTTEAKYNPFIQQILGDTQGMSTPQQIMQPEYMSVPTYKTQTSYNPDILANIGGAGITVKSNATDNPYQVVDLGGSKAVFDKSTGKFSSEQIDKTANTFDKTKVAQATVKQLGHFDGMVNVFDRLINNYDKYNIGVFDQAMHSIGKYTPFGSPEMSEYNQDLTKVLMTAKEMENLGAALTPNEQALLEKTLPNPDLDEALYKKNLVNYIRTLRDIAYSKVNSSDLAGYKTKELVDVAKKYDLLYEKAATKFGDKTRNKDAVVKPVFDSNLTVVQRFRDEDGKIVVKMSDGSMKYE